jgi:hypothetical protein
MVAVDGILPESLPTAVPLATTQTTVTKETSTSAARPSWLHTNLRNVLALGIGSMVGWLAYTGNDQAQAGLIAAFTVLVGMIFGERAALKRPGTDS